MALLSFLTEAGLHCTQESVSGQDSTLTCRRLGHLRPSWGAARAQLVRTRLWLCTRPRAYCPALGPPSSLQHCISFLSQCSPSCIKFQSWDTPTEEAQRERDLDEVTCRAGAWAYAH